MRWGMRCLASISESTEISLRRTFLVEQRRALLGHKSSPKNSAKRALQKRLCSSTNLCHVSHPPQSHSPLRIHAIPPRSISHHFPSSTNTIPYRLSAGFCVLAFGFLGSFLYSSANQKGGLVSFFFRSAEDGNAKMLIPTYGLVFEVYDIVV